ncbi:unnamed protein product [Clavelina lepadiformis]|uniref:Carboxylesterase type B domain-containing protein n=1 Tax=Clavelina lepadiformis TaxID=159417 RepID=A0ABP0H0J7_CLALP
MTECPIVETVYGKVKGRACPLAKAQEAKQVFRYSRIPFAKPPVDDLRFEPPEKCEPWDGIRDCVEGDPIPQQSIDAIKELNFYRPEVQEFENDNELVDEDCLYLRVYTNNPNKKADMPVSMLVAVVGLCFSSPVSIYKGCKFPPTEIHFKVMVWFYGGAFLFGNNGASSGQVICGLHDVVLVVPNYRVSVFGFLSLGRDTACPGNFGMLDQVMALQ